MISKNYSIQKNSSLAIAQRALIALIALTIAETSKAENNVPISSEYVAGSSSVNLESAAYTRTWSDQISIKSSYSFGIIRNYSSRRVYLGLFGFGWCSNLEAHLKIENQNQIKFRACDPEQDIEFTQIDYGLYSSPLSFGPKLLRLQNGDYKLFNINNTYRVFSSLGRLLEAKDEFGSSFYIKYDDSGRPIRISRASQPSIDLRYSNSISRRIASLQVDGNTVFRYSYLGNNLIKIMSQNQNSLEYEYDSFDNLTKVLANNLIDELIGYDRLNDRVLLISNEKSCSKNYDYKVFKLENRILASVRKACGNEVVFKASKEFFYKKVGQEFALQMTKLKKFGDTFQTTYDLKTGQIDAINSKKYNLSIRCLKRENTDQVYRVSSPQIGVLKIYRDQKNQSVRILGQAENLEQNYVLKLASNLIFAAPSSEFDEVL